VVVDRFEVDFEGAAHRERLVRSDRVDELPVPLDFEAKLRAVVDLESVQVLVLEGAEGALADAVFGSATSAVCGCGSAPGASR